ncbi:type I-C CRISPR-associated endonuclease Cas1c [Porphyromonas levii]|uniref:type I-C CRISPR-associated endonuclease Cas1c n=1 Tax=Porphyromonas levii TaxID=28114 RepID=UPI001B8BC595|nr:type I-C CRISPR-associated endonuclease Cas1c [Porphyromonas levii]MBR8713028.1 CRISPR-associated endonuclease Cas1 [Porphyromonas levii]MBR8715075.1 CRISPR-associated endonuclease Cas1 [Porphyromonas levii]MBR8727561.1 CRISPR-associated endonuclease Cas1 [Porphyromonas levii]MBR8735936.1 CRISPR-associated endonuclease Cas1 [Porphyromonas levii]MBR8765269.1 CRISPR-associated endonuclease Cas1 [Porphyromonas levii]
MRQLLNTLYVLTPNAYLTKDRQNIVVKVDDTEKMRVPIHNLESIICFTYMGASPGAMQLCTQNNVKLSFHTPNGRFIASIQGPIKGNVLLRRTQYRIADDEASSSHFAAIFIAGKMTNQRAVLSRFLRDHQPQPYIRSAIEEVIEQLKANQKVLATKKERMGVMGVEGYASQIYFSVFRHLILRKSFSFNGRSRRPPKDEVNALLSFFYTILTHDVQAAIETVGLDPYVGFLHTDRPGRASLALDLMEELRAYIADRFVLSVINKQQVTIQDFMAQGENGYILKEEARKKLLAAWQKRKRETILEHPFLKEKIPLGLLPYTQALLLARCLRGDLDDYPVFIMR